MLKRLLLTFLFMFAYGKEKHNRTGSEVEEKHSDETGSKELRGLVEKLATKMINEKFRRNNFTPELSNFDENSSIDMQIFDEQATDTKSNVEWTFIGKSDDKILPNLKINNTNFSNAKNTTSMNRFARHQIERFRRDVEGNLWIQKDFEGYEHLAAVQALIVKDEQISGCHEEAPKVTDGRYFMCSGAILTQRLVITTASCLQLAIFYEGHIEANIGVLVGSMTDTHYVIKVIAYKIHPAYNHDVNLPEYSTHNLAILLLNCPIPEHLLNLPRIPTYKYNDVGHMCCPNKCDMLTIVQKSNNRHKAKYLAPAFLPTPNHNFDDTVAHKTYQNIPQDQNCGSHKLRRSVAPMPDFSKIDSIAVSKRPKQGGKKKVKTHRKPSESSDTRRASRDDKPQSENEESSLENNDAKDLVDAKNNVDHDLESSSNKLKQCGPDDKTNCLTEQVPHKLVEESSKIITATAEEATVDKKNEETDTNVENMLTSMSENDDAVQNDTNQENEANEENETSIEITEDENHTVANNEDANENENSGSKITSGSELSGNDKKAAFVLTKTLVDETMERLQDMLEKANKISPHKGPDPYPVLTNKIVNTILTKTLTDLEISPEVEDFENLESPRESYGSCPPLGSPVLRDNILVGLVAYTCDDLQNWVKWTYVSIAHNIDWIFNHFGYKKSNICKDKNLIGNSMTTFGNNKFAGILQQDRSIIQRIQSLQREHSKMIKLIEQNCERHQMEQKLENC